MGTGRKLVLLALAAGLLRAADSPEFLYRFHLPSRAAKVDWTSASAGNWDVTVTVDAVKCRLTCAYRLKRGSPAASLLAPPVVFVRVYSDFVSLPYKLTVDPAGLEFPAAAARFRPRYDYPYLPGRKLVATAPPRVLTALPSLSRVGRAPVASRTPRLSSLDAPLRI
ncbi:MAG: hypothetical protein P4L56_27345 [Candidatus Sulfopaludibacter sp.]|nr:hypothetical protein [Candidatus Sulfopaludibacter sp.]